MVTAVREDQSRTQRKNVIINGNFDIWQRGVTFAGLTGPESYTADRWLLGLNNSGTWTVTRDTSVPVGVNTSFSLKATVTTADGVVNAGDYVSLQQRIEGYNFFPLYQRSFTFTFWVKSNVIGTYNFSVRNSVPNRSYVTPFMINVADTWEFKTITVTATPVGGTWNFTNGIGAYIDITLVSGTTYQTTAGAWQTGNFLSSAGQVNLASTIGNYIQITQVQLERGATPSLIEARSFGEELALCQRCYEKSYGINVNPGTVTDLGRTIEIADGLTNIVHTGGAAVSFAESKRTAPTMIIFSTATGTSGKVRDFTNSADVNVAQMTPQETSFTMTFTQSAANITTNFQFQYTADAEL